MFYIGLSIWLIVTSIALYDMYRSEQCHTQSFLYLLILITAMILSYVSIIELDKTTHKLLELKVVLSIVAVLVTVTMRVYSNRKGC